MKVGCAEYQESFEIKPEDITYEKMPIAIKCPKCGEKAHIAEVDVYVCECGLVWMIEDY